MTQAGAQEQCVSGKKPNIVVIMRDDIGMWNIGVYHRGLMAETGNQDRLLPLSPDFAEWLLKTAEEQRTGTVFHLPILFNGRPITPKTVSRIVSAIGDKAVVIVNKIAGKFASAHDLRRSFGTR